MCDITLGVSVHENALSFDNSFNSGDWDSDVLVFNDVRITLKSVFSSISFFLPLEALLRYDFFP